MMRASGFIHTRLAGAMAADAYSTDSGRTALLLAGALPAAVIDDSLCGQGQVAHTSRCTSMRRPM